MPLQTSISEIPLKVPIATSEGYFIAQSEAELLEYEESLKGREDAIRAVRLSIARQRRILYEQKREEKQSSLFNK